MARSNQTPAEPTDETPAAGPSEDQTKTVGVRHPMTGHAFRCPEKTASEWVEKGYELVPHSGGHGNPPAPSQS